MEMRDIEVFRAVMRAGTTSKAATLLVQAAHAEPHASHGTVAPPLAAELRRLAGWLGLERVTMAGGGDLAPALAVELRLMGADAPLTPDDPAAAGSRTSPPSG